MAQTSEKTAGTDHPTPKLFWKVGAWLTILTALEIWAYYLEVLRPILIPLLIVLSVIKFILVVGYFMHLKWDSRTYTGFFLFGFIVAVLVYIAVVWMSGPAEAAALMPY